MGLTLVYFLLEGGLAQMNKILIEKVPPNLLTFHPPPTIGFKPPIKAAPPHIVPRPDNCSALA